MPRESKFQTWLINTELPRRLPGCFVLKNDSGFRQGIPDLTVLWERYWAILEVKAEEPTSADDFEPNQEWYLDQFNQMSFAACIYPENCEEVLDALQRSFAVRRTTRASKR